MTILEYKDLFNELINTERSTILNLIYVSLISSDTITDLERCNRSKKELQKMLEAVACCDINNHLKKVWEKRIHKGLEICESVEKTLLVTISYKLN